MVAALAVLASRSRTLNATSFAVLFESLSLLTVCLDNETGEKKNVTKSAAMPDEPQSACIMFIHPAACRDKSGMNDGPSRFRRAGKKQVPTDVPAPPNVMNSSAGWMMRCSVMTEEAFRKRGRPGTLWSAYLAVLRRPERAEPGFFGAAAGMSSMPTAAASAGQQLLALWGQWRCALFLLVGSCLVSSLLSFVSAAAASQREQRKQALAGHGSVWSPLLRLCFFLPVGCYHQNRPRQLSYPATSSTDR